MRHGDRRPGVSVGEGGVIGDSHSPRQVSHRGYGGNLRFYGNSFLIFSPHGWSPVTRTAQRGVKGTNGELPVLESGNEEGPEARGPSPRAHSRWTARLPTARLPFCGGEKKKKNVSVQRAAGFPSNTERREQV